MSTHTMSTVLGEFARVAKAMANPVRLHLLDLLSQAERNVEDLAVAADVPIGNTSAQLKVLRDAGLVCSRREGTRIFYRLAGEDVTSLYATLRQVSQHRLPAAEALSAGRGGTARPAEVVTREEVLRKLWDGKTVLIDVRPTVEYASAHIPGAISIPLEELRSRMNEIPVGGEVIAYCRSAHCLLSREAVWLLRAHGRCARQLEEGMLEWRLHCLPAESQLRRSHVVPARPRAYVRASSAQSA
ncbi:transcriptional regulator [Planomonospora parontospora subsp. parontospora]|uniref:Transcriptional regulator n=3 Tax=Planomonospora parontospora TaxID=58119 RepID=A0AA37F5F5_9ACTN|nr:metalloregulator ArsR/SmtB family transcription factor [Planomonospora parontospora]GGK76348.1 transcriptional regulator [Planomonospora parontospora]GII10144.1 transcriptional regulator [Planomonospora parontospora subsp. parontospora]